MSFLVVGVKNVWGKLLKIRWASRQEVQEAVGVLMSHGCRIEDSSSIGGAAGGVWAAFKTRHPQLNWAALSEGWGAMPVINADSLQVGCVH